MLSENLPYSVSFIQLLGDRPRIVNRQHGTQKQPARPNSRITTATAFFYRQGENHFIGTNKHVLEAVGREDGGERGEIIETQAHSVSVTMHQNGAWGHVVVPLKQNNSRRWKAVADPADLALLPFDPSGGATYHPWSAEDLLPINYTLELAEPLISMGYPLAFYDNVNNRPILRRGALASEYGVNFRGSPYFLTDINHFPGNSGSPVITLPKQVWHTKDGGQVDLAAPHCLLAGVHSRREHVVAGIVQQAIDLGLGVTWYASLIEDLAATF